MLVMVFLARLRALESRTTLLRPTYSWPRWIDWLARFNPIIAWLVLPALLAGLALADAAPARAQQSVGLASLEIALWPEFDKPSVLVIMNGQVAAGVVLPASLSIH